MTDTSREMVAVPKKSRTRSRGETWRVDPAMAREAWSKANGDLNRAYSEYINLHYKKTGVLAPGCDNVDLQAWINQWGGGSLWIE